MTGQLALPGHQNATEAGAVISDCGTYRYALWRTWDPSLPVAVFVMLNPSTADADQDDPTIRRCVGFAKRWRCGSLRVVNLFAYRATDPAELRQEGVDIVGPDNGFHVALALSPDAFGGGPRVAAWGAQPKHVLSRCSLRHERMSPQIPFQCLGTTKDGNPRHPLMVPYATELRPWPVSEARP